MSYLIKNHFDTILCHLQSTDILFLFIFSCFDHAVQLLGLTFFLVTGYLLYEIMFSETFWSQCSWWMVIYRARKCRSVFHLSPVINRRMMSLKHQYHYCLTCTDMLSVTYGFTNKLMTFKRKIMRKIFGPTRTNDGYCRIKTNQEINDILKG